MCPRAPLGGVAHTIVVDTVLSMGKNFLREASALLCPMTLGTSSVTDIKGRTGLERDEGPPEVTTKPVLRIDDARYSSKEWPFAGFALGQVAEAGLGRGGVLS